MSALLPAFLPFQPPQHPPLQLRPLHLVHQEGEADAEQAGGMSLGLTPQAHGSLLTPHTPAATPAPLPPIQPLSRPLLLSHIAGPGPQQLCISLEPALLLKGDVMVRGPSWGGGAWGSVPASCTVSRESSRGPLAGGEPVPSEGIALS